MFLLQGVVLLWLQFDTGNPIFHVVQICQGSLYSRQILILSRTLSCLHIQIRIKDNFCLKAAYPLASMFKVSFILYAEKWCDNRSLFLNYINFKESFGFLWPNLETQVIKCNQADRLAIFNLIRHFKPTTNTFTPSWRSDRIISKIRFEEKAIITWRSGYCYLNKGECSLSQSKDDSFVERVAKNNSWNNGDRHKIHEIFLINCFVFVITLVWKTVHNSAMTQIKTHLMVKTLQITVPR